MDAKAWLQMEALFGVTKEDKPIIIDQSRLIAMLDGYAEYRVKNFDLADVDGNEARKAANRSQFMSNHIYDHKSYEDGFFEGMNQALRQFSGVGQSEQLLDDEEELKCPDHTPYWGVCSTCGQY